ncbi:MAG: PVC-type heme-binding CxxCH protein [Verrucomicrobiales bacterium]
MRLPNLYSLTSGALAGLLLSSLHAQSPDETDYARLLPPIPPREPAEALESFALADEALRIELVAAEPLLRDPMALDFDERGRLYVVEFPEYNQRYAPGGIREGDHGRVRLLADTDGDGRMDESTVFADELGYASAVFCWDGGVFVGVAPDILYLKDTDGDGKADHREVVLTGFAREEHRAGQAPLNSFRWGFDNRIHVSTNFSGGAIRSSADPDGAPVRIRNRDIAFDPRTGAFEATSGGGQHGMSFDDWGRRFVCRNSEPVKMIFYDDRYLAGNPWLAAPAPAVSIAKQGKYTPLFSISSEEPWRVVRTRMRSEEEFAGPVEGPDGTAKVSGYFTAASGVTVYRGDALPDEYRGDVFTGEAANNLVHRARLAPDGVGLVAERADPDGETEFLASTDNWFRPVQMAGGPDGALYVADMYRFLIEGAKFLPPEVLKHLDLRAGADRGRIYRITSKESSSEERPENLGALDSAELAALLAHPNGWHRETASRILFQRQDQSAVDAVRAVANDGDATALGRTHARYTLQGLGALGVAEVKAAFDESDADALPHALRLAESFAADHPETSAKMVALTEHPEAAVRYQAAWSLGAIAGGEAKTDALVRLLSEEHGDSWMRLAAFSAIRAGDAGPILTGLLGDEALRKSKGGTKMIDDLVEQIGRSNHRDDAGLASRAIAGLSEEESALSLRLLRRLLTHCDAETRAWLIETGGDELVAALEGMLTQAERTVADDAVDPSKRASAIEVLRYAEASDFLERAPAWLEPGEPPAVHRAAIESLGHFQEDAVGDILVAAWPALGPEARSQALETLLARPERAERCLDAIESGVIGRGELGPARVALLRSFPEESVRSRARQWFADGPGQDRVAVVERYRAALEREGDAERGRAVFRKACVACHRLEKVGNDIGAGLQGIGKSGAEAILLNILDPNRDVKPEYLVYTLTTGEGQSHSGMIRSESANSFNLRRLDGSDLTILRTDVAELSGLGISFMPDGLEAQISVDEMADLLAYLETVE